MAAISATMKITAAMTMTIIVGEIMVGFLFRTAAGFR